MAQRARGIQSIEVSGRILRALVDSSEPMMLKELARFAELAPAQCHAYLTSLKHVGLVYQEPVSGLYRTGSFALRLGIGWLKSNPFAAAAIRELKSLTDEFGVMSLLVVWGVSGPTVVHMNAGVTPTAMNIRQGTLFSVTGTASGRLFAAFGDAPDLEQRIMTDLDQHIRRGFIGTVLTREDFDERLKATRAHGYATAESTPIPGINAVAAPIFDRTGTMRFAATLLGPMNELDVGEDALPVRRLVAAARELSGVFDGPPSAAIGAHPGKSDTKASESRAEKTKA